MVGLHELIVVRAKSPERAVSTLSRLLAAQRFFQRGGLDDLDDLLFIGRCIDASLGHVERTSPATGLGVDLAPVLIAVDGEVAKVLVVRGFDHSDTDAIDDGALQPDAV